MRLLSGIAFAAVALLWRCAAAAQSAGALYAEFSIRQLHDCIDGRSNVTYYLRGPGSVTVFSKPYNDPDDIDGRDYDANVADCEDRLGLSYGYMTQRIHHLDPLPPGNLPPDSDYVPFMMPASGPWHAGYTMAS